MSKSSTKHLDDAYLDDRAAVIRDTIKEIKSYCGLFAFVASICMYYEDDEVKKGRIDFILKASMEFMKKKYEANINVYLNNVSKKDNTGMVFSRFIKEPYNMRNTFEFGLVDAEEILRNEINDILLILGEDFRI
jgi:IMP cyclohydrolase